MRILYLTHNGLTEPLGQSQVLPYLVGVSRRGADVAIVSFEPSGTSRDALERVRATVDGARIEWDYVERSARHDLATKVAEAARALALATASAARKRPRIAHTRSYVFGPVIEAIATATPGCRMLFDCRGLLADEYVDVGHWSEDDARTKAVRAFERHAFRRADGLVFLTRRVRDLLRSEGRLSEIASVEVVPCCVDLARFAPSASARDRIRSEIGAGARPVIVYSGSLSGWYLVEEMARFVGALRQRMGPLRWLVLSRSDTEELRQAAQRYGVPSEEVICRRVPPQEMPDWLAAGDLGLSLIKPCFSKLGSSPTKVAEYLGVGMPVLINAGIGDQEDLAREERACVLARNVEPATLDAAAERAATLLAGSRAPAVCRELARSEFDVDDVGIARYARLYSELDR